MMDNWGGNASASYAANAAVSHTSSYTAGSSADLWSRNSTSYTTPDAFVVDPHCGLSVVEQCEVIRTIKKVIFGVTIVSDVIALVILVVLRRYKNFSQRIFLNILLCNFVEAIGHQINDGVNTDSCLPAAFIVQGVGFALFMWVCGLTVFLFLLIMRGQDSAPYEKWYCVVCWGVPLILAILPFTTGDYGPAGAFCWVIGKSESGQILRFAVWWIPVMIGVFLMFSAFMVMYCSTARNRSRNESVEFTRNRKRLVSNYLRPMTGYAVTFVIIHTLMVIDRLRTIRGEPLFAMRVLHIISISSYGLILCTLFYMTNGRREFTKRKLYQALRDYQTAFRSKFVGSREDTTEIRNTTCITREPNANGGSQIQISTVSSIIATSGSARKESPRDNVDVTTDRQHGNSTLMKPKHKTVAKLHTKQQRHSLSLSELNRSIYDPGPMESISKQHKKVTIYEEKLQVGVLDETMEFGKQSASDKCCGTTDSGPALQSSLSKAHISYPLEKSSQVLKVYKDQESVIWESWKEDETVEIWTHRLQERLDDKVKVTIKDRRDGAYFGNQTWGEIKEACGGSLRIVIDDGITDIDLVDSVKERSGSSSDGLNGPATVLIDRRLQFTDSHSM